VYSTIFCSALPRYQISRSGKKNKHQLTDILVIAILALIALCARVGRPGELWN
jgi:hypothetical protein